MTVMYESSFNDIAAEISELNDRIGRIVEAVAIGGVNESHKLFMGWPRDEMSDLIARMEQLEDDIVGVRCRFDYEFTPTEQMH